MRLLAAVVLFTALAFPTNAVAQTTGFPGINDLTINGMVPGSTSCTLVVQTGLPLTFNVSSQPGVASAVIFDTCPCRAGAIPLPTVTCMGSVIPQSIDLWLGGTSCIVINIPGVTDASGNFTFTLPPCPTPFRFSAQGLVLVPGCGPFLMTQAYQVSC